MLVIASRLGDFLWGLLVIFFMVTYFMILFHVIVDVFSRHDTSGWNKALWLLFLFVVPLIGLTTYLIVNGGEMAQRRVREAEAQQQQFDTYVRDVAADGGAAGEIAKAQELLDQGAITQDEFDRLKAKALAS